MQARLTLNELHQIKWLIGGVLAWLSIWSMGGLDLFSTSVNLMLILVMGIAFLKPNWSQKLPEVFWGRFAVPLILILVLIDFGLGFTSLVAPLMRLVVLLIVYRAFAPRKRREDLQMLLLCLFGIIVSGAITVSLLFAFQILVFTPIAMTFLLIVCLLDQGPEWANYQTDWNGFILKRLIKRVFVTARLQAFVAAGILFVSVVAISTGIFVLIPRFDLGQSIPFTQLNTKPRTGFSDKISLDSVSEITRDQSIAMRIDLPDLDAIRSLPYWRLLVLDSYKDGEFYLSRSKSYLRKNSKIRELSDWNQRSAPSGPSDSSRWTVYFEGGISQYLPLTTFFKAIQFTNEQAVDLFPDLHVISLDSVQPSTFSYQMESPSWSPRAPASRLENKFYDEYFDDLEAQGKIEPRYPLTTLGLDLTKEEKALLRERNEELKGTSASLTAAEYSKQATSYLRANYRYSLKPDGITGSGDPIISWLKNGRSGHCELYAGSFVLLAREAGYPARMAVGFVGGSWNAVEDFFVVRNSDAHAWAEIYDVDTDEWLRVDPTPGESPADPEVALPVDFRFETGMFAWVDSVRMQWYRRVISFDQRDQTALATSFLEAGKSFWQKSQAALKELLERLKNWISGFVGSTGLLRAGSILVFLIGLYYLWRRFFIWLNWLLRLSGQSNSLSPVRKRASRYMQKVRARMSHAKIEADRVETFRALNSQLEALRFGEAVSCQLALPIFKRTRKALWKQAFKL